jgi:hypothetical protein
MDPFVIEAVDGSPLDFGRSGRNEVWNNVRVALAVSSRRLTSR